MPIVIAMLCVLEWRLIEHAGNSKAHPVLAYTIMVLPFVGILVGAIIYTPIVKGDGHV